MNVVGKSDNSVRDIVDILQGHFHRLDTVNFFLDIENIFVDWLICRVARCSGEGRRRINTARYTPPVTARATMIATAHRIQLRRCFFLVFFAATRIRSPFFSFFVIRFLS